ncbi:MAG: beta-propeller fold lactonase family protein [Terriglobales bacterium]
MTLRRTIPVFLLSTVLVCLVGCSGAPDTALFTSNFCSGCQFLYATTNSGQILTFREPASGAPGIGTSTSASGPANSRGLVVGISPDGATRGYLYVSDPQTSAIRVYTINRSNGALAPANVGPYPLGSGNGTPGEIVGFGNLLYIADSTGKIVAFTMNPDGSLTAVAGSPFVAGAGVSHLALVSSAGGTTFLYAANSDDASGSISAFKIGPNGTLTAVPGSPFPTVQGGGPEGLSGGGKWLYVALKNAGAVAAFAIADDGSLTPLAGSPFPAGQGTYSITGAGGALYAINNAGGTISSYAVDPFSGNLTTEAGSPFPGCVSAGDALYSNGIMFLPCASSNSIAGFEVEGANGTIQALPGSPFPSAAGPIALTQLEFPVVDPP